MKKFFDTSSLGRLPKMFSNYMVNSTSDVQFMCTGKDVNVKIKGNLDASIFISLDIIRSELVSSYADPFQSPAPVHHGPRWGERVLTTGQVKKIHHILSLSGANEKLVEKLTEEARERIAIAISTFTAITDQLVEGNIKINLLKFLLERRHAFLALLKIGNWYIIF